MRPLIIINDAAAKARAAWPVVRSKLEAAELEFDFHETTMPGDATVKTRDALNSGVNTIVVIGGDGTLSEAAQGFFKFSEGLEDLPRPINTADRLAGLPAGMAMTSRAADGRRESLRTWIDILIPTAKSRQTKMFVSRVLHGLCDGYKSPFICLNASPWDWRRDGSAGPRHSKIMRLLSGEARLRRQL